MASPILPPARLAVLDAVRSGCDTVNAIAESLGVTDNAVRLHLVALERDGFVGRRVAPRSGRAGQPAAAYALTNDGELALSRAYPPAFIALVASMAERLPPKDRRRLYIDAGRRLGAGAGNEAHGSFKHRVEACAVLLDALGGDARATLDAGEATLHGTGCPLAAAVRADPASCTIVEAMLERYAGVDAEQHCEHGANPRCRFHLTDR